MWQFTTQLMGSAVARTYVSGCTRVDTVAKFQPIHKLCWQKVYAHFQLVLKRHSPSCISQLRTPHFLSNCTSVPCGPHRVRALLDHRSELLNHHVHALEGGLSEVQNLLCDNDFKGFVRSEQAHPVREVRRAKLSIRSALVMYHSTHNSYTHSYIVV